MADVECDYAFRRCTCLPEAVDEPNAGADSRAQNVTEQTVDTAVDSLDIGSLVNADSA